VEAAFVLPKRGCSDNPWATSNVNLGRQAGPSSCFESVVLLPPESRVAFVGNCGRGHAGRWVGVSDAHWLAAGTSRGQAARLCVGDPDLLLQQPRRTSRRGLRRSGPRPRGDPLAHGTCTSWPASRLRPGWVYGGARRGGSVARACASEHTSAGHGGRMVRQLRTFGPHMRPRILA
jgi:hypothetical protein